MTLLVFLICFALGLLAQYTIRRKNKNGLTIPGPRQWPLIGNALLGIGAPEVIFANLLRMAKDYPRFAAGKLGTHTLVFLFDPDDVETVLKCRNLQKSSEYEFLQPWLGNSIGLRISDSEYKTHKKIFLTAFRLQILLGFFDVFNRHSQSLVDSVSEKADTGKEFDIMDYLYSMQMSILLETQLGADKDTLAEIGVKYGRATSEICKITHRRMYSLWMRPDIIFKFTRLKKRQDQFISELRDITTKVINDKKEAIHTGQFNRINKNDQNKKLAFLDCILEAAKSDKSLTDEQIRDEVMFMMFAGQDTSAITVAFAICLLAYYREVQDKVHQELDEVLGKSDDSRNISHEDTLNLNYLDAVIRETLRLFPSVPILGRRSDEDIYLKDGFVIPKNSSIGIGIIKIHRHEQNFPDPEEFRPERFIDKPPKERHPYSYIPFSTGQRGCLGYHYSFLSMKVTLAKFFSKYRVTSDRHPSTYQLLAETTLKRKEGFPIRLHSKCEEPNMANQKLI